MTNSLDATGIYVVHLSDTGGRESYGNRATFPGYSFGFASNSGRIAGENAAAFASGK